MDVVTLVLAAAALAIFVRFRWNRLAGSPRPPAGFTPLAGLALFYAMMVLGMVGSVLTGRLVVGEGSGDEAVTLTLAEQTMIVLGHSAGQVIIVGVVLWLAHRARTPEAPRTGVARAALIGAGALILAWPVLQSAAAAAGLVVEFLRGEPPEHIAHDTLSLMLDSPPSAWLAVMGVTVVVVTPVLEEVAYRGILQQTLSGVGLGRWTAILVTSAVFALMHAGVARWHALAALFVLSVALGWVYEKTGRLAAAISMHVLFNAMNLTLGWMGGWG